MVNVKSKRTRAELTDAVMLGFREASGLGVLHSQAMAERMGVSPTELECLDIVIMRGPITAGDLARASGLTTGAITGLVDRLERAGLLKREADASDRRKVMLRATAAALKAGAGLAQPMAEAMQGLLATCDEKGLAFMADFLARSNGVVLEAIQAVRAKPKPHSRRAR